MKIQDLPHISINETALSDLIDKPTEDLNALKDGVIFLEEYLTDEEKVNETISTKIENLKRKIIQLEKLIKQMSLDESE